MISMANQTSPKMNFLIKLAGWGNPWKDDTAVVSVSVNKWLKILGMNP